MNNYTNEIITVQNLYTRITAFISDVEIYFHLKDGLPDPCGSLSSQPLSQGGREGAKGERQQHKTRGTLEYNCVF